MSGDCVRRDIFMGYGYYKWHERLSKIHQSFWILVDFTFLSKYYYYLETIEVNVFPRFLIPLITLNTLQHS